MQLATFEQMLIDRLVASGRVKAARSFGDSGYPLLYGVLAEVDGGTVPLHLTRGSGTGDVEATDDERAAHAAKVAELKSGTPPRAQYGPAQQAVVEAAVRDVLLDPMPPCAVLVEGQADGRERPGVKVRFDTGAEIYVVPTGR